MPSIHMTTRGLYLNGKKKTTVALEPCFWEALQDIAQWERKSLPAMVREVESLKDGEHPLTSAIRLFILRYHRSGAAARRMTSVVEHNPVQEIEQSQPFSAADSCIKSDLVQEQ